MSFVQIIDTWVGEGRKISTEQFARACDTSQSTVYRWVNEGHEPKRRHLTHLFSDPFIPVEFKKLVADSIFYRCDCLRVEMCDRKPSRENPMRLAINANQILAEAMTVMEAALEDQVIDEIETAHLEGLLATLERKMKEVRAALASREVRRVS